MELLEAALAWHAAGCAVVPVTTDGLKHPAVKWKPYQTTRPGVDELRGWFGTPGFDGLGLICGRTSGGLELFEVEARAVGDTLQELVKLLADNGLAEVWARLESGYVEESPSGGLHWLYRVDGTPRRNTKLARRPATPEELQENPDERVKTLIETRGEAGYTVAAPSAGRTHPTGRAWRTLTGTPESIPVLSADERDAVYAIAAMLDAMPPAAPPVSVLPHMSSGAGAACTRPGDDFNARASWLDILAPHGWRIVKTFTTGGLGWARPGKAGPGMSATTGTSGDGADRLYVFSTSTVFETEAPYSKFAAYALLEHAGDYSAAARALREQGYGEQRGDDAERVQTRPVLRLVSGGATVAAPDNDGPDAPPAFETPAEPAAAAGRVYPMSDDGNACALVDTYGEIIRYCADRGRWLAWDGRVWAWCPASGGIVREYVKRLARDLPEGKEEQRSHKRRSLSAMGTSATLAQAETDPGVAVRLSDLDAHPWELNTPAGILDLRTGVLGPSDPARLHTRLTLCAPDPDADASRWESFLRDTFGGDDELVAYLQRLVGYSAVGMVGPHVLPFCHGSGGNGKGVFVEAVRAVLGDYATTAPSKFLMATAFAGHETEIARLAGARMVVCSEVNEDDRFDEAKVKLLAGGDTLTARFMRADHFSFTPTHQLWLVGNHQPTVKSGGRSFWRRLRLIPFEHEVPEQAMVEDLQGILAAEHGPALMSWIAAGAAEYNRRGLADPARVRAATEAYARDQDTVTRFVEDCCHLGPAHALQTRGNALRAAYERWCAAEGEDPVSAKALTTALRTRHGVDQTRVGKNRDRAYTGIALLSDNDDDGEDGR